MITTTTKLIGETWTFEVVVQITHDGWPLLMPRAQNSTERNEEITVEDLDDALKEIEENIVGMATEDMEGDVVAEIEVDEYGSTQYEILI